MAIGNESIPKSVLEAAEREIERNIHEALIERITERFMASVKETVQSAIKKEVEKYTVNSIEQYRSANTMLNELHVYLHCEEMGQKSSG